MLRKTNRQNITQPKQFAIAENNCIIELHSIRRRVVLALRTCITHKKGRSRAPKLIFFVLPNNCPEELK